MNSFERIYSKQKIIVHSFIDKIESIKLRWLDKPGMIFLTRLQSIISAPCESLAENINEIEEIDKKIKEIVLLINKEFGDDS